MVKTPSRLRLCIGLLIVNLMVIWGNSLLPGSVSGAISDWVKELLLLLLPKRPSDGMGGGGLIRKLAHFTEFACLGICLSWLVRMVRNRRWQWYVLPLTAGILTACIDETIQRFVPGRHGCLTDVGIDTLGVVTGIVIISLIVYLKQKMQLEEKSL